MGSASCCEKSEERANSDNFDLANRNIQRPFSERNYNNKGEISVPYRFDEYEATEQYIPKRDKVIIRSSKIFEDSKGKYISPYRKKIIHQIMMKEREKINKQLRDPEFIKEIYNKYGQDPGKDYKNIKQEIKEKLGVDDYEVEYLDPIIQEYLDPGKAKEMMSKGQHEQNVMYEYNSFDLSNKKNIPIDRSRDRHLLKKNERDNFERVYNVHEGRFHYADEDQVIESRGGLMSKPNKRSQGYLANKHMNSDEEIEHGEIVEHKGVYFKNRDTQTPVRVEENKGIQYDSDDAKNASFKRHKINQKSTENKSIEHEELPFSTIKKRDKSLFDSDQKIMQTPLKDMDEQDIIALIKNNEKLQREIINDPVLRERLYEKFSGMRNSASDQTLPHSFWSSKHGYDRRTQGDTDYLRTPMRSLEDKYEPNRFTQFAHSDLIGDDGTIYDHGTGYKVHGRDDYSNRISDEKHASQKVERDDDLEREEKNFSFKDKQRNSQFDKYRSTPEDRKKHHFKSIDVTDNENELAGEGDQSSEGKVSGEDRVQKIRLATYPLSQDVMFSSSNKSSHRGTIKDSLRRTSEYKRKYHNSPMDSKQKLLKDTTLYRARIDIDTNRNHLYTPDGNQLKNLQNKNYSGQELDHRIRSMTDRNAEQNKRQGKDDFNGPNNRRGKSKYLNHNVPGDDDEVNDPEEQKPSGGHDETIRSQRHKHYKLKEDEKDIKNSFEKSDKRKELPQKHEIKNLPDSKLLDKIRVSEEIANKLISQGSNKSDELRNNKSVKDKIYDINDKEDVKFEKDTRSYKEKRTDKYMRSLDHERDSIEGNLKPGEVFIQNFGSSQDIAVYKDIHGENMIFHQDEFVYSPREHSDFHMSNEKVPLHQLEKQKYLNKISKTDDINVNLSHRVPHVNNLNEKAKNKIYSQTQRKSNYRTTKERINSVREHKLSSSEEELKDESERQSLKSKNFKILKARDYQVNKKLNTSKKFKSTEQSSSIKKKNSTRDPILIDNDEFDDS